MNDYFNIIKKQIQLYSFEKLRVSQEPINLFEKLAKNSPQMIQNAKRPELISAAIIYLYLKAYNLNGKGGITTKDLASHFNVSPQSITSKVFDVDCALNNRFSNSNDTYEFIDKNRFKVGEIYYDFLESPDANDYKKSEKLLKSMIKMDPDFFDPYTVLHEYYINEKKLKKAFDLMAEAYSRAIKLIAPNEKFPDILHWGYIENRHIIRLLFNYATLLWIANDKDKALEILLNILKSNPNDNIGARYSILGILENFESQDHLEEYFISDDGEYLDWEKQEEWFFKNAKKYPRIFNWWLELEE
jgi:tetratricopeptide (TPR) repeat protein